MRVSLIISLLWVVLATCRIAPAETFADLRQLPVAPHLHSRFSDGDARIVELVAMARAAGYAGLWVTDHTDVCWKYPVLGTTVGYHRNSLLERGFEPYLQACARAQARNPDMLLLPGFEASPYYYWEGSLFGTKLVNHQWMKHLIVAGIEDPAVYRTLPLLAYGHGPYHPGRDDAGEAPYREFVAAVTRAGGLCYWAHPFGSERRLWGKVHAQVAQYTDALLTVPASTGMAIHGVNDSVNKPGGTWDMALAAYCTGTRAQPPWPMVEIDYHRGLFTQTSRTLVLLLPAATDASTRKVDALDALRRGRYYVTGAAPKALILTEWSLADAVGNTALPGDMLATTGALTVRYSITAEKPLQWVQVVRNGSVVQRGSDPSATWSDSAPIPVDGGTRGYYRLLALTTDGAFLISTPIFYVPEASSGG